MKVKKVLVLHFYEKNSVKTHFWGRKK